MDAFNLTKFKLPKSASEQNVYFNYVCLVNDIVPEVNKDHVDNIEPEMEEDEDEDEPIQVAHSKALHELFQTYIIEDVNNDRKLLPENDELPTDLREDEIDNLDNLESQFLQYDNPNILKLTRMKWLSDGHDGAPDASSPSLSPSISPSPTISTTSSNCSQDSCSTLGKRMSVGEKCLNTILQLDKEHNLFGLSNIAVVGNGSSKKIRKNNNDKPIFHQTAIVQVCCRRVCCRHRSNTDLPSSLKCGGCNGCFRCRPFCGSCNPCSVTCRTPCVEPPTCPSAVPCIATPNCVDCYKCNGLKIMVNKKPDFVPDPPQLTPRASCILAKPYASRPCPHCPPCLPPSSCFPYLMPCFWPARPSAPCPNPSRCFHNPPCPPRRKPKSNLPKELTCPLKGQSKEGKNAKCTNPLCVGNIPAFKKEYEKRYKT